MAIDDFFAGSAETVEILENSDEAVKAFTKHLDTHGNTKVELTPAHIEALQKGKCIAVYDGEFSTFLTAKVPEISD
ncbi:hypothetical protein [Marinobacter sp. ELB17]|uniref:hypothetical protein n=1 Tax=Marinobacter sp. ELB17 TaxID=270374 RepID=UPI0000F361C5|nr:hypothetical protein [Marinobacter sp. ELB17]EAZ97639.1 hypothetical protein MELB17_23942 [Marinobacter sp. ELB17]